MFLCTLVAAISFGLEALERRVLAHPYVEALVVAILLGMTIRSVWTPPERWLSGIAFSAKQLLELAVALLGASVSFAAIAASDTKLLGVIVLTVLVTLGLSFGLSRLLGLPAKLSILIACGNSICGIKFHDHLPFARCTERASPRTHARSGALPTHWCE